MPKGRPVSASEPVRQSADIVLPELGLEPGEQVVVSCWLVSAGETVVEGDRLLEVLADRISYDVPSPATGRLVRVLADVDDTIRAGQVLGTIAVAGPSRDL